MQALLAYVEALSRDLPLALLVAARVGPLVVVAPFFSTRGAPATVRLALIVALTLVFFPLAERTATLPEASLVPLLALRELAVGAAWAIAVGVPFHAMDIAGRLTDLSRGANLAEVIAPATGDRTSPLGDLLSLATVGVFFALGGHRLALLGFADALETAPIGVLREASMGLTAARIVASSLTLGVSLALPVVVSLVVVEVGLGLVARASPRIQIFFLGMPLRAGLGVAVLALVLTRVFRALPGLVRESLRAAGELLSG